MTHPTEVRSAPRMLWLAVPALLLILAVGLTSATISAIDRGWVRGPDLELRLGDWYLLARTSTRPECLPIPPQQCFISFPVAAAARPPVYAVWIGRIERMPSLGEPVTISSGRYVLYRPIVAE